ncbi:proline-rich transmembrane protein 1-like isoform X2 [Argopecten irradians]|uniref:proline-rich transmembrane protein 1-like isoform X2 n=1 Tax=Argopecten irradians TaxID=31199 RepID=UPI0037139DD4
MASKNEQTMYHPVVQDDITTLPQYAPVGDPPLYSSVVQHDDAKSPTYTAPVGDPPLYSSVVQHDDAKSPTYTGQVQRVTSVGDVNPKLVPGVTYNCTRADPVDSKQETVNLITQQQPQPLSYPPQPQPVPQNQQPSTWMALSICGCLCCIWPLGIINIILSSRVASYNKRGDIKSAKDFSCVTLILNIINVIGGLAFFLYFLHSNDYV